MKTMLNLFVYMFLHFCFFFFFDYYNNIHRFGRHNNGWMNERTTTITAQCGTSFETYRRNLSMASVGHNSEQSSICCSWRYIGYHWLGSIEKSWSRKSKYLSFCFFFLSRSLRIHFELIFCCFYSYAFDNFFLVDVMILSNSY